MKRLFVLILSFLLSCSGHSLYSIKVKDLSGKEVSLKAYEGQDLILYVWSGTCIGHTKDLRRLVDIYPELKGDKKLISVAIMMDYEDVKQVLKENGIEPNYPVYADPKGELAREVKLLFLPATIFVNGKGEIVGNYPRLPEKLLNP